MQHKFLVNIFRRIQGTNVGPFIRSSWVKLPNLHDLDELKQLLDKRRAIIAELESKIDEQGGTISSLKNREEARETRWAREREHWEGRFAGSERKLAETIAKLAASEEEVGKMKNELVQMRGEKETVERELGAEREGWGKERAELQGRAAAAEREGEVFLLGVTMFMQGQTGSIPFAHVGEHHVVLTSCSCMMSNIVFLHPCITSPVSMFVLCGETCSVV